MVKRINDQELPPQPVEVWRPWPVSWTGVWVGALTALATLVVFGLIAVAVGSHLVGPSPRILSWTEFGLIALAFAVGGAFFSFVAGGWVAARVTGTSRAETAMLHGGLVWLVAVPLLVLAVAVAGHGVFGPLYGGLASTPSWVQAPTPKDISATDPDAEAKRQERDDAAKATRNSALGALTSLILGLAGSVLGGWLGSGEPMSYRQVRALRASAGAPPSPVRV